MRAFFKMNYSLQKRTTLFGCKMTFIVHQLALFSDDGQELILTGVTSGKMRRKLLEFIIDNAIQEIVGYDCAIETPILQYHLLTLPTMPRIVDMLDQMKELAASLDDECFGAESDFTLQKYKLPDARYSIIDKLEMLQSHPEFPTPYEFRVEAMVYAKWLCKAYNFKFLQMFLLDFPDNDID